MEFKVKGAGKLI